MSDWNLTPVYLNSSNTGSMIINQIQLAVTNGSIVFGLFYDTIEFFSVLGNITIRNNLEQVMVMLFQYVIESGWSFVATFLGVSIETEQINPEYYDAIYQRENTIFYDPTIKGVEFNVPIWAFNSTLGNVFDLHFFHIFGEEERNILVEGFNLTENVILRDPSYVNSYTTTNTLNQTSTEVMTYTGNATTLNGTGPPRGGDLLPYSSETVVFTLVFLLIPKMISRKRVNERLTNRQ